MNLNVDIESKDVEWIRLGRRNNMQWLIIIENGILDIHVVNLGFRWGLKSKVNSNN